MRIRISDRILVALAGLIMLAMCAGVVAQVFFGADVVEWISCMLNKDSVLAKVIIAGIAAAMMAVGVYCVLLLFRHRKRRDRFIMQKMESGDLSISLKALETMIAKCIDQHKEIQVQSVHTENQRDGLMVSIRGTVAGGISIPLTVDTLQKQIKQYVTACSGVEVKGIKVMIESSGEEAKDAMFAIDAPTATPLLREAEKADIPEEKAEHEPADESEGSAVNPELPAKSAAEAALEAAESLKKEYDDSEEDDRPIHQRLFSTPEEPCIMPLPPEKLAEPVSEKNTEGGFSVEETDTAKPVITEEIPDQKEVATIETRENTADADITENDKDGDLIEDV